MLFLFFYAYIKDIRNKIHIYFELIVTSIRYKNKIYYEELNANFREQVQGLKK